MRFAITLLILLVSLSQSYARESEAGTDQASSTYISRDVTGQPVRPSVATESRSITPASEEPAQERVGSSSSSEVVTLPINPSLSVSEQNNLLMRNDKITVSAVGCVAQGDMLMFSGQNLTRSMEPTLVLNNNDFLGLKFIRSDKNRLVYQLPNDKRLLSNHRYKVVFVEQNNVTVLGRPHISLLICRSATSDNVKSSLSEYEPGQILISAPITDSQRLQQEILSQGYRVIRYHELIGLEQVLITLSVEHQEIEQIIVNLRARYPNADIDKNSHFQPTAQPRIYARDMIAWSDSYSCNMGEGQELTVGIIDSDIDQTHPALEQQNIVVKSFINEEDESDKQHGTAIAVVLAGDKPELGYVGLLSGAKIMAASTIRRQGEELIATTEGLIRSIDWMLLNHVRLINISLAGTTDNFVLKSNFKRGIQKGLIIFAAAGNGGKHATSAFPAALPGVISVTAIDAASQIYEHANQGDYIDFSAPGVDIWSSDSAWQGRYRSGTSFAAPHALAVAALYLVQNPSLPLDILYSAMKTNAKDLGLKGKDEVFGWGLVQTHTDLCN